jgi:hypothetical protein
MMSFSTASNNFVAQQLQEGVLWPEPLLQLNPTFLPGGTIDDLVANGTLHSECARIFRIGKSETDPLGAFVCVRTSATIIWSFQVVTGQKSILGFCFSA